MNRKKIGAFLVLVAGLMFFYPLPAWTAALILTPDKKLVLRATSGEGIIGMTEEKGIRSFLLKEERATVQVLPDSSTLIKSIKGTVKVAYKENSVFIPDRSQASLSLLHTPKRLKVSVPRGAAKPVLVISGNASIILENGQGVIVSRSHINKVFISVTKESIGQVKVTVCRTLARMPARGEISATMGENTPGGLGRGESGRVDFITDNGEMGVLNSGQTINDTCTPPPAEVLAVPEEVVISPSAP